MFDQNKHCLDIFLGYFDQINLSKYFDRFVLWIAYHIPNQWGIPALKLAFNPAYLLNVAC